MLFAVTMSLYNKLGLFDFCKTVCQNISKCLKLNRQWLSSLSIVFGTWFSSAWSIKYNSVAKFKRIPVKTVIRLFDATVLPILTYGSEV